VNMRPTSLRRCLEQLFSMLEPVLTACLYPWCLLRQRWGNRTQVPILMYHQVGRPVKDVKACEECVSPERFERQIRALADSGYRAITLSQLTRILSTSDVTALRRSVVLTFDDGLSGQFVNAHAVLRRYGLPATFFLVAGYVGRRAFLPHMGLDGCRVDAQSTPLTDWRTLSWEEAAEMSRDGIEIGCHSLTHRSLGALPPADVDAEVRLSKQMLEHHLGTCVSVFAYPFGSHAYGDFNQDVEHALATAGYQAACTTVVGTNNKWTSPLALRRIPMEERDGPFRLRCKLVGAYNWVGAVKNRWQRLAPREERVDIGSTVEANASTVEAS
jgi:peptidoglycan/xylan/chitin deacetylase (PgdA/CDA1 family)